MTWRKRWKRRENATKGEKGVVLDVVANATPSYPAIQVVHRPSTLPSAPLDVAALFSSPASPTLPASIARRRIALVVRLRPASCSSSSPCLFLRGELFADIRQLSRWSGSRGKTAHLESLVLPLLRQRSSPLLNPLQRLDHRPNSRECEEECQSAREVKMHFSFEDGVDDHL